MVILLYHSIMDGMAEETVSGVVDVRPADVLPADGDLVLNEGDADPWPMLVTLWLDSGLSAKTRESYGRTAAEWAAWCKSKNATPLNAGRVHVDQWMRELETAGRNRKGEHSGQSSTTRARKLASLASLYDYLADVKVTKADGKPGPLIETSPVARVKRPKTTDRHKAPGMTQEQARLILAAAKADGKRTEALVRLLLTNVLRISEALGADVEDLGYDRRHRILRIMGKGSKAAKVPLTAPVADAIDAYLDGRTSGPLFATATGKRLDRAAVSRTIDRLAKRAGLAELELSSHSMRATGITLFLDAGGTLREAQQLARHADPRTTEGYDRARGDLDNHGAYKLSAFLGE